MSSLAKRNNLSRLFDLYSCNNDIPELLEKIYEFAEYPGNVAVKRIVEALRDRQMNKQKFIDFFMVDNDKTENMGFFVIHIISTLLEYFKTKNIEKVYEWW